MQLHPLVDTSALFIGHDAQNEWLYVDWRGEPCPVAARASGLLLLRTLRAWPCTKLLNDNSGACGFTAHLTSRGGRWLEQLQAAGLRHVAWVLPRHLPARQVVQELVHTIERPRVGTFDDVVSAYAWLQQQPLAWLV